MHYSSLLAALALLFLSLVASSPVAGDVSDLPSHADTDLTDESCPKACPEIYAPICATTPNGDFDTFDNECFMEMENCGKDPEDTFVCLYPGKCFEN